MDSPQQLVDTRTDPPASINTPKATPVKPNSAPRTKAANGSTPRQRSRPAPLRSFSSPLARTMSVRVTAKDRRWSMRIPDPTSPVSTTYRDDYIPPDLSSKLRSLNLDTTLPLSPGTGPEHPESSTTYRESYRWWAGTSPRSPDSPSDRVPTPSPSHGATVDKGRKRTSGDSLGQKADGAISPSQVQDHSDNSQSLQGRRHRRPPSRPVSMFLPVSPAEQVGGAHEFPPKTSGNLLAGNGRGKRGLPSPSASPSSLTEGLAFSPTSESGSSVSAADLNGITPSPTSKKGPLLSVANRQSTPLSLTNKKSMPLTLPSERSVPLTLANGRDVHSKKTSKGEICEAMSDQKPAHITNGQWSPEATGTSTPKPVNRTARPSSAWRSGSDRSSAIRSPTYQLQSSNGGCPFAYGSDSGAWV